MDIVLQLDSIRCRVGGSVSKDAIFTLIISYPAKLLCMLWQNKDIFRCLRKPCGFPGDSVVKNPPANAGDTGDAGSIPGLGRSLEKEMATHPSVLAWAIPWTEEPGRL